MRTFVHRLTATAVLTLSIVFAGFGDGRAQGVPTAHIAIVDYIMVRQQSQAMIDLRAQIEQRRQAYQEHFNPHFPSIVDIQCGEKAILL